MGEWQPMNTAPMDGTWVLLWWPHWHHSPQAGYHDGYEWHSAVVASGEGDGPEAWMPLPAPPTEPHP